MVDDAIPEREKTIQAMEACVTHARDLVASARAVQASGQLNIAYHLAALALEELGRRELIGLRAVAAKETVPPSWPDKHTQDHVKKLFWCFFGGDFLEDRLSKEDFDEATNLAERVHANRIAGLYVDANDDGINVPRDAIEPEHAVALINLAEARLRLAEAETPRQDIPAEEAELQAWFLRTTNDRDKQRQILSKGSLDKLAELKDTKLWARWLREEFENAEREGKQRAQEELKHSQSLPVAGTKDKWRLRVRIQCASHSIRPKTLTAWNKKVDWIKLSSDKKGELAVEFVLKDNTPIEALWWFGWGLARHFVVALNIGTMEYWWWRLPQQTSRYYERLDDLENKAEVVVERSPSLRVDWGANRVLTEEDLDRVISCFVALPGPDRREQHAPYNFYTRGLTFLSLNDIHWQCETFVFGNFLECLKAMMTEAGHVAPNTPFEPVLTKLITELYPESVDCARYGEICHAYETKTESAAQVTLGEAAHMKLFCDHYFLRNVVPSALRARAAAREIGKPRSQSEE